MPFDLGNERYVKTIRWGTDASPGARVEVRSRTGDELDVHFVYHDSNDKVVTEKRYNRLIPRFKGRIDTIGVPGGDWSPWSRVYLEPGEPFQSPSPRRFLELEVALVSERRDRGAVLDFVAVDTDEPLAGGALGEVFPVEVQPGEQTEFTYFVRPLQVAGAGFDQLRVESSAAVDFREALVAGQRLDVHRRGRCRVCPDAAGTHSRPGVGGGALRLSRVPRWNALQGLYRR